MRLSYLSAFATSLYDRRDHSDLPDAVSNSNPIPTFTPRWQPAGDIPFLTNHKI